MGGVHHDPPATPCGSTWSTAPTRPRRDRSGFPAPSTAADAGTGWSPPAPRFDAAGVVTGTDPATPAACAAGDSKSRWAFSLGAAPSRARRRLPRPGGRRQAASHLRRRGGRRRARRPNYREGSPRAGRRRGRAVSSRRVYAPATGGHLGEANRTAGHGRAGDLAGGRLLPAARPGLPARNGSTTSSPTRAPRRYCRCGDLCGQGGA